MAKFSVVFKDGTQFTVEHKDSVGAICTAVRQHNELVASPGDAPQSQDGQPLARCNSRAVLKLWQVQA